MTALETPTVARDLQRRMRGAVIEPGGAGWEDATRAFNLAFTQEPTLVAVPEDEHDVVAVVGFAREHGLQVAPAADGPQRRAARRHGRHDPAQDRPPPRRRARRRAARRARARRLEVGGGRPARLRARPRRAARLDARRQRRRLLARRRRRLVRPQARPRRRTASPRSSSSPPTAGCGASTTSTSRSSSGRSAAAAATSASSRRSSSSSTRSPRSTPASSSSRGSARPRCCTRGSTGRRPCRTRSPRSAGSSSSRRSRSCRSFLRGQNFVVVEAVFIGSEGEGAELLEPLRALGPAIDTFAMVPPVGLSELHMDPPEPVPYTGEGMMLGELDAAAIDAFVAAAGPELRLAARLGGDPPSRRRAPPGEGGQRGARHVRLRVPDLRARDGVRRRDVPGQPEPARSPPRGVDARTTRAGSTSTSPRTTRTRRPSTARTPTGGSGP